MQRVCAGPDLAEWRWAAQMGRLPLRPEPGLRFRTLSLRDGVNLINISLAMS